MAKWNLTRLLETSKYVGTEAGSQLKEMIQYLAEFVDLTGRSLRRGLTFADNFDCEVKEVTLRHGEPQVVSTTKAVQGVIPTRVLSSAALESFAWYYDGQSRLTVRAKFDPAPTDPLKVALVLLF